MCGRANPAGEVLDAVDERLEADGVKQIKGVLGAGEFGVDDRVVRGVAQSGYELSGVPGGHEGVLVAVGDEQRGRVGMDVPLQAVTATTGPTEPQQADRPTSGSRFARAPGASLVSRERRRERSDAAGDYSAWKAPSAPGRLVGALHVLPAGDDGDR